MFLQDVIKPVATVTVDAVGPVILLVLLLLFVPADVKECFLEILSQIQTYRVYFRRKQEWTSIEAHTFISCNSP